VRRWLLRALLFATMVGSGAVLPATAFAGGNVYVGNCYYQIFRPNSYMGGSNYQGYGSISCPQAHSGFLNMQVIVYQLITGGWQAVPGSSHVTVYGNPAAFTAYPAYSYDVSPVYKRWYCTWAWAEVGGNQNANYSEHSTQAGTGVTGTCPNSTSLTAPTLTAP
jgi:hypothetical protein